MTCLFVGSADFGWLQLHCSESLGWFGSAAVDIAVDIAAVDTVVVDIAEAVSVVGSAAAGLGGLDRFGHFDR